MKHYRPQNHKTNVNARKQNKLRVNKKNNDWKENDITIVQEPGLEKCEGRNWNTNISTSNITELNKLIYAGMKCVRDNISVPLGNLNSTTKAGWEIKLEKLQ